MEIEDDFLIIPFLGSSELGNGSPRPRPRPRPRPGPKTCPRECFDRTVELLKTKCEGPNPAAIIKCVFKGTSDSVKPCLPCVCENICKAVTKGGPIYNLCTACRPPFSGLIYLHCLVLACIVFNWLKIYFLEQIKRFNRNYSRNLFTICYQILVDWYIFVKILRIMYYEVYLHRGIQKILHFCPNVGIRAHDRSSREGLHVGVFISQGWYWFHCLQTPETYPVRAQGVREEVLDLVELDP